MTIHAFTDGASRGNPGESGVGIILKDDSGAIIEKEYGYIGRATNNIAEYTALIGCLKKVVTMPCTKLVVHSDSELMVRQMQGRYRVKDKGLLAFYSRAQEILSKAPFELSMIHIDRSLNKEADLLANLGIDSKKEYKL